MHTVAERFSGKPGRSVVAQEQVATKLREKSQGSQFAGVQVKASPERDECC